MAKFMIDNIFYCTCESNLANYTFEDFETQTFEENSEMKETYVDYTRGLLALNSAFDLSVTVSKDSWLSILGVKDAVLDICPNKRVVHLAKHGSKKTRKKNFHRAIRILEEQ